MNAKLPISKIFFFVVLVCGIVMQAQAIPVQKLLVPNDPGGGLFGGNSLFASAVAISGNTALVGASVKALVAPATGSGAVYFFTRDPVTGIWSQLQKVVSSNTANGRFGSFVAMDGNTAVITDNPFGFGATASAYIYTRNPVSGIWAETQVIPGFTGAGLSLALYGDTLLIGVPASGTTAVPFSGTAVLYTRNPATGVWSLKQTLSASNAFASGKFGTSVVLSRNRAVIGSPTTDNLKTRSAYVFKRDPVTNVWAEQAILTPGDPSLWAFGNDSFGSAVSIFRNTIVVGARHGIGGATGLVSNAGAAYVFKFHRPNNQWIETHKLVASNGTGGAGFGAAVSILANRITVGAPTVNTAYNYSLLPSPLFPALVAGSGMGAMGAAATPTVEGSQTTSATGNAPGFSSHVTISDFVGPIKLFASLFGASPTEFSPSSDATVEETPSVNVGVTMTVDKASPSIGTPTTYTIVVTNHGPINASPKLIDTLPQLLTAGSVIATRSDGGACTVVGILGQVNCNLGVMVSGASITVTITGTGGTISGLLTNVATIQMSVPDRDPGDNEVQVTTTLRNPASSPASVAVNTSQNVYSPGDTMVARASTTAPATAGQLFDLYVAIRLYTGVLLYMQPNGQFLSTLNPVLSNWSGADIGMFPFFTLPITAGLPFGHYDWFIGLVQAGTLNLISLHQKGFDVEPGL